MNRKMMYTGGGSMDEALAEMSVEEAKAKLEQLKRMVQAGKMTKEQAVPVMKKLMAKISASE